MDTTKFTINSIVNLGLLNESQLNELSQWCRNEAENLRWKESLAEQAAREAQWKREREEAEAKENALVEKLQKVVKPGVRLKMKGCKDGLGLREFIRWDGSSLVCWQLKRQVTWARDYKSKKVEEINTNIVTTHMPDKVQEIYVDGTAMKVRSILK